MSGALVTVPASDKEHSRTIGDSSDDGAGCNSCASRVDLAAGTNVASHSAAVTGTSS